LFEPSILFSNTSKNKTKMSGIDVDTLDALLDNQSNVGKKRQ